MVLAGLLWLASLPEHAMAVQLMTDPHCQTGLSVLEPVTGINQGPMQFTTANGAPIWEAGQWGSQQTIFGVTPTVLPSGAYQWTNLYKAIVMGPTGTTDSDFSLMVDSIAEYGGVYRTNGQSWPSLLIQQNIGTPGGDFENADIWISGLSKLYFHSELRLNAITNVYTAGYDSGRHAAQFLIWFTIQNLNPANAGYGQYLWFGISAYDDRYPLPGSSVPVLTLDAGTGMQMYNIGIAPFCASGLSVGEWKDVSGDILPHIKAGLQVAWSAGYLTNSTNFADYKIGGMNLGWEIPGLSRGTMQVRNFGVEGYGAGFPEPTQYLDYFNRENTAEQTKSSSPNQIGTNWTIASGTWKVDSYQLKQAAGLAGEQTIHLNTHKTLNSGGGTNFTLQATVQLNAPVTDNSSFAGLVFNLQNASNYYAFRYCGNGTVQLISEVNGAVSAPLSVTGFTPVQNRPYTLTVFSVSPHQFVVGIYDTVTAMTVYTNASVVDAGNSFQDGFGGLYANANTSVMAYDNFSLANAVWTPPTILVQPPVVSSNYPGCSLTLSASIGGTPAPQFHWQFNGVNIPNATNQALVLNNLQATNAGSYVLYATNAAGWTNTTATAVSLSGGTATDDFNRPDTAAQTSASNPNLIGSHWTIASGTWDINSGQLAQAGGAFAGDQVIYLNPLKTFNSGAAMNFTIQATAQLNTTANSAYAGLVFNLQDAANYYAFRYNGAGGVQLIGISGGVVSTVPLNVTGFTPVQNRPYTLTVTSSSPHHFSVGIYDTVTSTTVYTNASVVGSGNSFQDGYGGLYASANAGVMAYDNLSLVAAAGTPPTVLTQPPAASSNYPGCSLTLSASISGTPAPQLQWRFNGVSIPNATNQTLVLNNLQLTNAGSYVLYATNVAGWINTTASVVSLSTESASDSFDRTNTTGQTSASNPNLIGSHWTIASGTWAINSGQLVQAGGAIGGSQIIYLNPLKTLNSGVGASFTLQANLRLNTSVVENTAFAGLVFNLQDAANYYVFRYVGNGYVQLLSVVGGNISGVFINQPGFTPVQNRPYTFTVSSSSPHHFSLGIYDTVTATTVYTNASVVGSGNSFQDGYGGLYASANVGVMAYDNFSLSVTRPFGYNRLSPPQLLGGGTVKLIYTGIPGFPYALEWATNLSAPIAWLPVITNTADLNGFANFTNTSAAPASFFRARQP